MTLEQFIEALEEAAQVYDFSVRAPASSACGVGPIRARDIIEGDDCYYCPITAVHVHRNGAIAALHEANTVGEFVLGLRRTSVELIMSSADGYSSYLSYSPELRTRLLAACGLKEVEHAPETQ